LKSESYQFGGIMNNLFTKQGGNTKWHTNQNLTANL
jgi:hypothetical protein